MNIDRNNNIFFLGIGGIGMSALARHFKRLGKSVCGYDKTPSPLTQTLQEEGIEVWFEDNPEIIPQETDLVVYTPAVPKTTLLFSSIIEKKLPYHKRAEVLGALVRSTRTIAVAGTHGKTTISTLIAHIFKTAGVNITAFLGGVSTNYQTNYLNDPDAKWAIVEADEFDRSFLHIEPDIALVSSLDADHLDIYGTKKAMIESFNKFVQGLRPNGTLVTKSGIEKILQFSEKTHTYSVIGPADLYCKMISVNNGNQEAALGGMIQTEQFSIGLPGNHNLENAIGAALVAAIVGIDSESIARGISTFLGVKRRFEKCFENKDTIFIDDYAHHPEEIRACIEACRNLYPSKKITVIFQPHLYSRTRDLAKEFASALALADKLIMLDIYPARELPIPGINSQWLLKQVPLSNKILATNEEVLQMANTQNYELLLTLGAGDIDRLVPQIVQSLKNQQR